jgi:hypothetical protein
MHSSGKTGSLKAEISSPAHPALDYSSSLIQRPTMNQMALLREYRSKHILKNSVAAAKQLRVFKAVLPITSRKSVFFELTQPREGSSSEHLPKR